MESAHCAQMESAQCDGECTKWYHCICVGMSSEQYEIFCDDYDRHNVLQWICDSCKAQNKQTTQSELPITWGKMKDLKKIRKSLDSAYQKIVKWKKNYMQIPRGKAGKTLIAEVTRLIGLFNSSKRWESVAIHMLQVLLPLILQKPSPKSKNREHVKYLNKRMEWWKHGKLEELISECEAIQKRLKRSVKTKKQSDQKAFCGLMLQGQVKKALKIVNHASDIDGKHDITPDIKKKLKEKHPKAAELKQSAITDKPETKTERVIFENITQDDITSNTKNSSGSGGPTQIDMDTWRKMICSKSYGTH